MEQNTNKNENENTEDMPVAFVKMRFYHSKAVSEIDSASENRKFSSTTFEVDKLFVGQLVETPLKTKAVVFRGAFPWKDEMVQNNKIALSFSCDQSLANAPVFLKLKKIGVSWYGSGRLEDFEFAPIVFRAAEYMNPVTFFGNLAIKDKMLEMSFSIPLEKYIYMANVAKRKMEAEKDPLFFVKHF